VKIFAPSYVVVPIGLKDGCVPILNLLFKFKIGIDSSV
jgi:hypothetical protein